VESYFNSLKSNSQPISEPRRFLKADVHKLIFDFRFKRAIAFKYGGDVIEKEEDHS
jgi:hypothetical protein